MIVLFKMKDLHEEQIKNYLTGLGYQTASFYSINSIVEKIMNPMVILTPAIYLNELEDFGLPIIPISIGMGDIKSSINEICEKRDNLKYTYIASTNEILWLKSEYTLNEDNLLSFLTDKQTSELNPN